MNMRGKYIIPQKYLSTLLATYLSLESIHSIKVVCSEGYLVILVIQYRLLKTFGYGFWAIKHACQVLEKCKVKQFINALILISR